MSNKGTTVQDWVAPYVVGTSHLKNEVWIQETHMTMPSCCIATNTPLNLIDKKGFSLVSYREREAFNDTAL